MAHSNEQDVLKGSHVFVDGSPVAKEYEHQEYPKVIVVNGEEVIVRSEDEEKKILAAEKKRAKSDE